jgi:hypothetical protein
VNAPDLRRSMRDVVGERASAGSKMPLTCDVIARLQ